MYHHLNQQHNSESDRLNIIKLSKQYQKQISDRRYSQKVYYALIAIFVAASIYLVMNAPSSLSIDKLLLGILIIWTGLFPGFYYLKDAQRPPIPFLPLVGLFYAITFGLPIFLSDEIELGAYNIADVSNNALWLTLIGLVGMFFAFYVSKNYLWKYVIKPIQLASSFSINRLSALLWLMLIGHTAYMFIPALRLIPSIGQLLGPAGLLGYGIFYLIWSEGKLPFSQTALLVCVFAPIDIIVAFTSGLLAQVMSIALFMIFVYWYKHQRIPIVLITVVFLLFLLFNPVKGEYRALTWKGENSRDSMLEKAQLFTELAIDYYNYEDPNPDLMEEEDSYVKRISHIITFSQVVEDTPTIVPYWNGYTYGTLLTKFIPRIIWRNKPIENVGNEFGHRYHLLDLGDNTTSLNLPWIVELYANFGTLGILLGMPFFGIFLAFVEQKFNNKEMNIIEVILGITVTFTLVYQEANFSLMIGKVFSLTVALCLIFKFFVANKTNLSRV